jgi:hypothetical protein
VGLAGVSEDGAGPAPAVGRRLADNVRLAILAVALAVQFGLSTPRLVAYRPSAAADRAETAVFVTLAVVGGWCAFLLLTRREVAARSRRAGVAVLLGCSLTVSLTLPAEVVPRFEHWSVGLIGWYGLVLLYGRSGWQVAAFLVTHLTLLAYPVARAGPGPRELSSMVVVAVSVTGFQWGVSMTATLVHGIADATARTAQADEELRKRGAAAEARRRQQQRRYGELYETTVPLLVGLADGGLDPRAATVRHRCAVEAARIRRLCGEIDDVPDRLVHDLGSAIDVAERHGTAVQLLVRGAPAGLPDAARRDMLAVVVPLLLVAASPVRVAVLRAPGGVRISVVAAAPETPVRHPPSAHVAVTEIVSGAQMCVEVAWPSP